MATYRSFISFLKLQIDIIKPLSNIFKIIAVFNCCHRLVLLLISKKKCLEYRITGIKRAKNVPFDSHQTSACKSNVIKFSSLSRQRSRNILSFFELDLILFTARIIIVNDEWSLALRYFLTRCCYAPHNEYLKHLALLPSNKQQIRDSDLPLTVPHQ